MVAILRPLGPPDCQQPPWGEVLTVRNGKVTEMVVYQTVEDALAAAGLPMGS